MRPETRINPNPGQLDAPNRLVGYVAKFNSPSSVIFDEEVCKGPFVEVIAPGAFSKSLRDHPDVRALYNHATGSVLGRTRSGTLDLVEDEIGLHFDLLLPDTSVGRDVRVMVLRGDIDGCSFGFFVCADKVELRDGLPSIRTLIEVHVFEITPATAFPAYDSTEVNLRSLDRQTSVAKPVVQPILNHARARFRLARD